MQYIKKLDYYLGPGNEYANFNIGIYDELYQQTDITELFPPVEFFEKAYEEYLFFYHHSANYLEIVEHFKALPFDGDRLYYILYYLSNLLVISYADKESRGIIFRHDDIVLRGVAYIQQLFEKIKKDKDWKNRFVPKHSQELKNWQSPAWDKNDFIQNNASYRHILTTYSYTEDDFIVEERPYYDIKKGSLICARLLPLEYLSLLAYEIHIPKARQEPDLHERIRLFRKIKSDIQTIAVDLTTTNDIGKRHKTYFDVAELLNNFNVYIGNVEVALELKDSNQGKGVNTIVNPVISDEQKLSFNPKTYGKDEIIKVLNFCATQIEKWQINNTLNDLFNDIPDNGKSYVYSNRFEFLQKLRIELENNSIVFSNDEAKFREIEKWTVEKMGEKVITQVSPLKFEVNKVSSSKQSGSKPTMAVSGIEKFTDIFVDVAWGKYVTALERTSPVLLTGEWHFIGNRKKHIGVVCSWFKDLQGMGIIKQNISRSKLASVLNQELQDFNMGSDGKTFDNISAEYAKFKQQLTDLTT